MSYNLCAGADSYKAILCLSSIIIYNVITDLTELSNSCITSFHTVIDEQLNFFYYA
jgi:hypothetical protein